VDGVSITHGYPRSHIWTFVATRDEQYANRWTCPCTKTDPTYTAVVPPFVSNDYFCDTSSRTRWQSKFYPYDPLWNGRGCGPTSSCCSFNSPPWFCKELPQPTTDDIEVRVCTDEGFSNEDTTVEAIELYVQWEFITIPITCIHNGYTWCSQSDNLGIMFKETGNYKYWCISSWINKDLM